MVDSNIINRLKLSREKRAKMIEKFGFVPCSILELHRGKASREMFVYQHDNPEHSRSAGKKSLPATKTAKIIRGLGGMPSPSGYGISSNKSSRVTAMPAELVEFFIKYYAKQGDIYLDPFMGQGIQMQIAWAYGLKYIGYDISKEYFRYIETIKKRLKINGKDIETHNKDAAHMDDVKNESCQFCFTSPPYWNIEYYGDEPEQLGKGTYEEFLKGMSNVAGELFLKMTLDCWCVINVNDFRKGGDYYSYHVDTINLFKKVGWKLHDIWIIKGLVGGMTRGFGVSMNLKRIAPRFHEYALVFVK